MTAKIAVCFFGITRSLAYTIESIEKHTTEPAKELGEVRVFAHFFNQNRVESNRSKEAAKLDPFEYRLLHADEVELEPPETCLQAHDYDLLKSYGDTRRDGFQSLRNLVHALHSLDRVTNLALAWHPDIVIFLRPDLLYHSSLKNVIEEAIVAEEETVFLPDWQHWRGGFNDRFSVCAGNKAIKAYGTRVWRAQECCEQYGEALHAETLNRFAIEASGVRIMFFPQRASRVRAGGMVKNEKFQPSAFDRIKTGIRKLRRTCIFHN